MVLALPKLSRTGLDCMIWSSSRISPSRGGRPATFVRYCMIFCSPNLLPSLRLREGAPTLVFSVFPAPDSPVMRTAWFSIPAEGRPVWMGRRRGGGGAGEDVGVGDLGDGEDVRGEAGHILALVDGHDGVRVDGEPFPGIDAEAKEP